MSKELINKNNRIEFITWLQFIGVLSVIIGHSMNSIDVPIGFKIFKSWFYSFHMPLFFFVSAFLFSFKKGFSRKGYKDTFKDRALRLLVPYYIWNLMFIIPKIIMAPYINDQFDFSIPYLIKLLFSPRDNILGHTWFLFALFEMFIIAILFEKLRNNRYLWIPVTLFLMLINCFGVQNRWFAIGDLMKNAIFFWGGLLIGGIENKDIYEWCRNRDVCVAATLTMISTTVIWVFNKDMYFNLMLLGMSCLVVLILLQINLNIQGKFIEFVSKNSFAIYILHWPTIMIFRFIIYTKMHLNPVITCFALGILGLFIPCGIVCIVKRIEFPFVKTFCNIVLGMREKTTDKKVKTT